MSGVNDTSARVERITSAAVEHARRREPSGPSALLLLIRQYEAGRDGVGDVLGDALALALDRHLEDRTTLARARWVATFAAATRISEDSRLADAAHAGIDALSSAWPDVTVVDEAAASIDACLAAAQIVDRPALIPSAIDALERLIAAAYQPGDGVSHATSAGTRVRGGLADHVRVASALLTGFTLSGRLPYSMLAEELVQASRDALPSAADADVLCEAAHVLWRLARLHDDAEYRSAAVIAAGADYLTHARRLLARAADQLRAGSDDESLYALAAIELEG